MVMVIIIVLFYIYLYLVEGDSGEICLIFLVVKFYIITQESNILLLWSSLDFMTAQV